MALSQDDVVIQVQGWDEYSREHNCMVLQSEYSRYGDLEWGASVNIDVRYLMTEDFKADPLQYIGMVLKVDLWATTYMANRRTMKVLDPKDYEHLFEENINKEEE